MSMQTLTWDVDAAVAGNSDAYSLASAMQARQYGIFLNVKRKAKEVMKLVSLNFHKNFT